MTTRSAALVVDDEPRNRHLLRAWLDSRCEVIEAASGPEAIALFEHERVDIVLLDVMMPGMDGFEVCRRLRRRPSENFLPIVLVTALGEQSRRNEGLAAGADEFLTKPVDRHELTLRVDTLLRIRAQDAEIRRQLDALRHLADLKDDLFSLLVHDIRNPLAATQATLEVLHDAIDEPHRAHVLAALRATSRIESLANDILRVRQIEVGEIELQRKRTDLVGIARAAVETMRPAAAARDVGLRVAGAATLASRVDPDLVRRAIENLVSNAIKYSPPGDAVDLHVGRSGGRAFVSVGDRGPGLDDDVRERLFSRYGAVSSPRRDARRGFGLGLYLVRLVAAAHGGTASAAPRTGGGTLFTMTLEGK